MKKIYIISALLFLVSAVLSGQTSDSFVGKCSMNAGANTTYLKDFRVQLPKGTSQGDLRYKTPFALSKNMKYRFTLCNPENSKSQLIMKIKDVDGRQILASFDPKSGKTFPSVEFTCNKTGTYTIQFDFRDFEPGLGVGIISLVK